MSRKFSTEHLVRMNEQPWEVSDGTIAEMAREIHRLYALLERTSPLPSVGDVPGAVKIEVEPR